MSETTSKIQVTEIDGVPTVWAPCEGPLRARLRFRVGYADEQPLTRGITHLVEHLALHGVERRRDHSDASVEATTLAFGLVGDEEHIVGRLAAITRQLHSLPREGLAAETAVLRAEAVRRDPDDSRNHLLTWRYGATTYGLGAFHELAIGRTTIDELHAWTHRFATRANAVLMLTGAPPAGLRLPLPEGEYHAPPDPRAAVIPVGRTTIPGSDDAVALHAVADSVYATSAAALVLRSRLIEALRTAPALGDAPPVGYERLTGDLAGLLFSADIEDSRAADATRAFVGVLLETVDAAREGRLGPHLEDYRAAIRQTWPHPGYAYARLDAAAWKLLHRGDPVPEEEVRARALGVDDAALATALTQITDSALLRLPPSADEPAGWVAAPLSVRPPLTGRRFEPRHPTSLGLVVADRGITRTSPEGSVTVYFEDVVYTIADQDRRALTGRDGSRVTVDASAWTNGDEAVAEIDRSVPPALVVEGPVPRTEKPGRFAWHGSLLSLVLIVLGTIIAVALAVATFRTGWAYILLAGPALYVLGKLHVFSASRQGTR